MTPKMGMEPVRRAQILNATLKMIAAGGLEGVTLEAVARAAGISKGVVQYYFKSKQRLLVEAFRDFFDCYNRLASVAFTPEMTAMRMLELMIDLTLFPKRVDRGIMKKIKENFEIPLESLGIVYHHFFSRVIRNEELQKIMTDMYQLYFQGFEEILAYGVGRKELRPMDTRREALALMAFLDGLVLYRIIRFQPLDLEAQRQACRDWIGRWRV